jgi:hypothetical protein
VFHTNSGRDPEDPAAVEAPLAIPDYVSTCRADGMQGLRIAVSTLGLSFYNSPKEQEANSLNILKIPKIPLNSQSLSGWRMASFQNSIRIVEALGATVIYDVEFESWNPEQDMREPLYGSVMAQEGTTPSEVWCFVFTIYS